jgi:hypothetical protein
MHITFREIKSALYFSFWVIFMIAFPLLLFVTFKQTGHEPIAYLICSCIVGILSGLSPSRSFLACFLALLIIAISSVSNEPYYAEHMLLFSGLGIFCGLIALASSAIRRVVLRSKTEQLHLTTWQWAILTGVVSALACYVIISFPYVHVDYKEDFVLVSEFISLALMGLFGLGLFAGAYYQRSYRIIVKNILLFSLGGHLVFVFFIVCVVRFWHVWKDPLFFPTMAVYFLVLFLGIRIGYRFRSK